MGILSNSDSSFIKSLVLFYGCNIVFSFFSGDNSFFEIFFSMHCVDFKRISVFVYFSLCLSCCSLSLMCLVVMSVCYCFKMNHLKNTWKVSRLEWGLFCSSLHCWVILMTGTFYWEIPKWPFQSISSLELVSFQKKEIFHLEGKGRGSEGWKWE